MSTASWTLFAMAITSVVAYLARDWAKRTGRAAPWSGSRTALRRRGSEGEPHSDGKAVLGGGLLGAGIAAQTLGPSLAQAESSACHAAGSLVVLGHLTDGLEHARSELQGFKTSLGDKWSRTLMAMPRWKRFAIYLTAFGVDVGAGLFVAHQMNIGGFDAFAVGASYGLMLFFAGHLAGAGLRRLDLHRGDGDSHPDIGKGWVSWVMVTIGFGWLAACCAGLMAARRIADGFAHAAASSTGQTVAATAGRPPSWALVLSSLITIGTFVTTLALAMKAHPDTRRLEELSWGVRLWEIRVRRGVRRVGRALGASGRALGLLNAAIAELQCRVGSVMGTDQWKVIVARATTLQLDHDQARQNFQAFNSSWTAAKATEQQPEGPDGREDEHTSVGQKPASGPGVDPDPEGPTTESRGVVGLAVHR